jgi:NACalpha-BTF3-like transcription factor
MADDGAEVDEGEIEEGNATKLDKQQGKQLNAITDLVEEKQLNESRVQEALSRLSSAEGEKAEAQRAREKELAAVKIDAADIDIIATETEWDRKVAERKLREHGGDAAACLRAVYTSA